MNRQFNPQFYNQREIENLSREKELRMKTEEKELLKKATFVANNFQDNPIKTVELEARITKLETELLREKNNNKILRELLINSVQQELGGSKEKLRGMIIKLKKRMDTYNDDLLREICEKEINNLYQSQENLTKLAVHLDEWKEGRYDEVLENDVY